MGEDMQKKKKKLLPSSPLFHFAGLVCGSSHEYSEVGQELASIARSKAVYSAIDSHALGGLKTGGVVANSTGRQTEV